jgi:hypothetical protein
MDAALFFSREKRFVDIRQRPRGEEVSKQFLIFLKEIQQIFYGHVKQAKSILAMRK